MNAGRPDYIVVEGPIGIGKTSLARRLAETFASELLLERAEENPFLERFYQDPRRAALPTQLFFLMQRAQQLAQLRQGDMFRSALVSDFLLDKDRLFAHLTLDDDELKLYEQIFHHLAPDVPAPNLVIYLQAPVEVLLSRIVKRGNAYERLIEAAYLQRLVDAYAQYFYQYDASPLLIVNAAEIDFVANDMDYSALVEQVSGIRSGRHYFNPLPFAL